MDFEVSKSLVTTLVPLLELHNGIGLLIVAVFMYLRSDSVLKMFGIGVGLLGLGQLLTGATVWLQPSEGSLVFFGIVGGIAALAAVVMLVIVGSSDYSRRWRVVSLVGIIIWALVLFVLEPLLDSGSVREYTEAGFLYRDLHAITTVWFMVGWFIAFMGAVHVAVEHSHGEPYKSVLIAAMSVYAVSVMVLVVASTNDPLLLLSSIVNSAMVLVMWVAVVVHERRVIGREREMAA